LLGCGSLAEREWDHANGYKQNQVKAASNKMRSNHRANTLFHFDRAPAKQTAFYWQRVKNVKISLLKETAGPPNSANGKRTSLQLQRVCKRMTSWPVSLSANA
jgi:hypothetical protein